MIKYIMLNSASKGGFFVMNFSWRGVVLVFGLGLLLGLSGGVSAQRLPPPLFSPGYPQM